MNAAAFHAPQKARFARRRMQLRSIIQGIVTCGRDIYSRECCFERGDGCRINLLVELGLEPLLDDVVPYLAKGGNWVVVEKPLRHHSDEGFGEEQILDFGNTLSQMQIQCFEIIHICV